MLLGYNTNGLAHHDPIQAVELLSRIGYRSVALTIDHGCLNPFATDLPAQIDRMATALGRVAFRHVLETGARFLLDPWRKHEPTLMTANPCDRAKRIDFLCRTIAMAKRLGSDCVSFWSGILRDDAPVETAYERLVEGLRPVLDAAASADVTLGFEPEPGMFIDTMARFDELTERLGAPRHFQLSLDVGHLHCLGETPLDRYIQRYAARIVNIHLEDMRAGVHEHLMFGEGEIDFPPVFAALRAAGYHGGVHVELSRHSHDGVRAAQQAFEFLHRLGRDPVA
jgi:L-ribulose-5-phosphate 3-epimerase